MKKIAISTMILVLSFAMVFVFPSKQANANPLAVGGALYLGGAGVYVLGAVAVGGIAGLAGCESCQEDIEAHAARTWDGSTQLVKDGMQLMVDASVGAWGATSSALTATDAAFNTWMDGQIDNLSIGATNIYYADVMAGQITVLHEMEFSGKVTMTTPNAQSFCHGSTCTTHSLKATAYPSDSSVIISYTGQSLTVPKSQHGLTYEALHSMIAGISTLAQFNTFVDKITENSPSTVLPIKLASMQQSYAEGISRTREAWQDMKDAGLVLPVDMARPMVGDIPLTYNPTTDTYAGIDGVTVPHEDVTGFEYQNPHWKTLQDLADLGLAGLGAGLYIDGWTGSDSVSSVYNPTTDTTTTTTDTSTTHTNVNTGETATSTTSTSTTTTGDTTGNPPVDPPPVTPPKTGDPINPFKGVVPGASILSLFQLLVAIIWYCIRLFTFIATIAFIAPTPIDNPYFIWFTTAEILGIKPYILIQNLALFFLGFSIYKSIRRVF